MNKKSHIRQKSFFQWAVLQGIALALASFHSAHAQGLSNSSDELKNQVSLLKEKFSDIQTENYYSYVGVGVFNTKELPQQLNLHKVEGTEEFSQAIEKCLMSNASRLVVTLNLATTLQGRNIIGLRSDIDTKQEIKNYGEEIFNKAIASEHDEYRGPGGYMPHCSIVVDTEDGLSFVIHAIDTY